IFLADDGGNLQGPIGFTSGMLSNSRCIVYGSGSGYAGPGNTLTVTLNMVLRPAYAGAQTIWAKAANTVDSGWIQLGTYTVAADVAPTVTSVSPTSGNGWAQTFTFNFYDADGATDFYNVQVIFGSYPACFAIVDPSGNIYLQKEDGSGQ